MRWSVVWAACLLVGLSACTGHGTSALTGPPAALANAGSAVDAASDGTPLPAGELVGRVAFFDGTKFVPMAGVTVAAPDMGLTAVTDANGRFGFQHLAAGLIKLSAAADGYVPFTLSCRLSPATGLARANLALVPVSRPAAQAGDAVMVTGVLLDPRGAALPGGNVHVVDSVSHAGKGGNVNVTADADGYFVCSLPGVGALALNNGQAELTGYGTTPGGVRVETTDVITTLVDSRPVQALTVGTTAFLGIASPTWVTGNGRARSVTGSQVPTRRDELVLHFEQDGKTADVAPDALDAGHVSFALPDGFVPGHGTLELRTLGLTPAPSVTIGP